MPASASAGELSDTPARVLVVTHGSFIREFLNVVHVMKGEPVDASHRASNTAIYTIRMTRDKHGALMPEILLFNDDSHVRDAKF